VEELTVPSTQRLAALDFWIGRWSVRARGGEPAGTDLVERSVDGHAVLEHWRDVEGREGRGFFWFDPATANWKQVWVMAGGVKLKELTVAEHRRVRFEGRAYDARHRVADRTTLTALGDGTVAQLIEHSRDGGRTWTTSFDAIYEPHGTENGGLPPVFRGAV
jgi:hypothetical protein